MKRGMAGLVVALVILGLAVSGYFIFFNPFAATGELTVLALVIFPPGQPDVNGTVADTFTKSNIVLVTGVAEITAPLTAYLKIYDSSNKIVGKKRLCTPLEDSRQFSCILTPPEEVGTYSLDVYLGRTLAGRTTFTIVE